MSTLEKYDNALDEVKRDVKSMFAYLVRSGDCVFASAFSDDTKIKKELEEYGMPSKYYIVDWDDIKVSAEEFTNLLQSETDFRELDCETRDCHGFKPVF